MEKIGKPESSTYGSDAEANVSILYAALLKQPMPITLSPVPKGVTTGSATYRLYVVTITTSSTGESRDGRKEQARNATR